MCACISLGGPKNNIVYLTRCLCVAYNFMFIICTQQRFHTGCLWPYGQLFILFTWFCRHRHHHRHCHRRPRSSTCCSPHTWCSLVHRSSFDIHALFETQDFLIVPEWCFWLIKCTPFKLFVKIRLFTFSSFCFTSAFCWDVLSFSLCVCVYPYLLLPFLCFFLSPGIRLPVPHSYDKIIA